jgi:hypothetical protein
MTKVTGHFDGKVVVPDEPDKLKPNQSVTIEGEPADPEFGTLEYVWKNMKDPLPDADAKQMLKAIEEACEQIDPESDVRF